MRRASLIVGIAVIVAGCGGSDAERQPERPRERAPERFFAPTSFWNRPLPPDAPVAANSETLVAKLREQVASAPPWINTTEYSVPVYRVGPGQPTVRVTLDTEYPSLARDFASVPVPPDARPAPGSDRHMVVWQPATDTMWEFWLMKRRQDGWHARWGAKLRNVSRSQGVLPAPVGATASGLPLVGGLMTFQELRRDRIDHALAIAIPVARAGVAAWPATRTDGRDPAPDAIPEGTRFRLDPALDIDSLKLPRPIRAMAHAVQRYGMFVRDQSGAVVFYAEIAPRARPRAYQAVFKGEYPNNLLEKFPWDRLQVVQSRVRPVTHG